MVETGIGLSTEKWLSFLGVKRHLKGFYYLAEAINISVTDHGLLYEITKGMYPIVAKKYSTTVECVERAMRHAVINAWNDECNCSMRLYFKQKPSNGALIRFISYKLVS